MGEREPLEFGPASPSSLKRAMEFVKDKLGQQEQKRYFSEAERSILTLHQNEGRYNIDHSSVHGKKVYRCRMVLTEEEEIMGMASAEFLGAGQASSFVPFVQQHRSRAMESDCRRVTDALAHALELPNFDELDRFTLHLRMVLSAKAPKVRRSSYPDNIEHVRDGQAILADKRVCSLLYHEIYAASTGGLMTTHCIADFVSRGAVTEEIWGPTKVTSVQRFELRRTVTQPIDVQTITTSMFYYLEVQENGKWHHRPIPHPDAQVCTREAFWQLLGELPTEVGE